MTLIEQISQDIQKYEGRGLVNANDLSILTNLLLCEKCLIERKKKPDENRQEYSGKHSSESNKIVDRDINALYLDYTSKREIFRQQNDGPHKQKMLESLNSLLAEIYDLIYAINCSAILTEERDLISDTINKMNNI